MRRLERAAISLFIGFLTTAGAQAAMLTDWNAADVISISDPTGDAGDLSRDITALHFRQVGGDLFFRLDIGAAPIQQSGSYAPEYSVQIDFPNGQGGGANPGVGGSNYIGEDIGVDIDTLVLSHYTLAGAWTSHHRHLYEGPAAALPRVDTKMLVADLGGAWDHSEGGGTILQWQLPASELMYNDYDDTGNDVAWTGGAFTIYGVTQSIDVPNTFDTTVGSVVPEPATLGLLLLGVPALLRRRR